MSQHNTPPEVDARGNINAHYQTGVRVPVASQAADGTPVNIAGAPWFFIMKGFRKALAPDPANPTGKLLLLTKEEVQQIAPQGNGADFVVVDETNNPPDRRWEGRIIGRGWK